MISPYFYCQPLPSGNMAMEKQPFLDDLPFEHGHFPASWLLVYQRVICYSHVMSCLSKAHVHQSTSTTRFVAALQRRLRGIQLQRQTQMTLLVFVAAELPSSRGRLRLGPWWGTRCSELRHAEPWCRTVGTVTSW